MIVLVIPSWYPPFGGYFFQEQCEALHNKGISISVLIVDIISLSNSGHKYFKFNLKPRITIENDLVTMRKNIYKLPKLENYTIKRYTKTLNNLYEIFWKRFGHPDIIHAHSIIWGGFAASYISKRYNIPLIITEHRSRFVKNQFADELLKTIYYNKISSTLKQTSKLITVSSVLNKKLIEYELSIENKIITIPNMVDTDFFQPTTSKRDDNFIFFSLGRLDKIKGMDLLLKAFKKFLNKFDDNNKPLLKIGGNGPDKEYLLKLMKLLSLEKYVKFLGHLDRSQVLDQMQQADCFVLPSRFEAFGVVFIEAMSCGVPVIAAKSGGPEHIIRDTCGLLVENDNVNQLSEALYKMYININNYNSSEIRNIVLQNYGIESVSNKIIQEYNEVLHGKC